MSDDANQEELESYSNLLTFGPAEHRIPYPDMAAMFKAMDDRDAHRLFEKLVIEAALPFANDDMDRASEKDALHKLNKAARKLKAFEASIRGNVER